MEADRDDTAADRNTAAKTFDSSFKPWPDQGNVVDFTTTRWTFGDGFQTLPRSSKCSLSRGGVLQRGIPVLSRQRLKGTIFVRRPGRRSKRDGFQTLSNVGCLRGRSAIWNSGTPKGRRLTRWHGGRRSTGARSFPQLDRMGVPRRRNARKMTDESVSRAAALYSGGASLAAAAREFGVHARTLAREFHRSGVAIRQRTAGRLRESARSARARSEHDDGHADQADGCADEVGAVEF